jgi:hypothetical protein
MGFLPLCAPDGERRKPCGQGLPLIRSDGAVVKATNEGGRDNEDDDVKEDNGTSTGRWVSGSGTPGSFCLASRGLLGLWRLWFLCWESGRAGIISGRPLFFHELFLILESSQFR